MTSIRWHIGPAEVRESVERSIIHQQIENTVIRSGPRRQLARIETKEGPLLIKCFATLTGRHRLREQIKQWFHQSSAEREWKALVALTKLGVRVPQPIAWGLLANGNPLLVMNFISGKSLAEALQCPHSTRRTLLSLVGQEIHRMHVSGYVHGDLHTENLIVAKDGPVIIDLQSAYQTQSPQRRYDDLAAMDYGLWGKVSRSDRLRLRAAALNLERPLNKGKRRIVEAVGQASERRAFKHAASRTRRVGFPGRQFEAISIPGYRGLRIKEFPSKTIDTALKAHRSAIHENSQHVIKNEARSRITRVNAQETAVVVKQIVVVRILTLVADIFRGSAGRRAWFAGHGLSIRGVEVARPLAYLERRRFGLPVASYVILEDLKPAPDALTASQMSPDATFKSLTGLLLSLHLRSIDHPDMKATNILLCTSDTGVKATVLDIEGVRFRKSLTDQKRIRALVQLNASIPDNVPSNIRRSAFLKYTAILPFMGRNNQVISDIAKQSISKQHRWTGKDCNLFQKDNRT